MTQDQLVGGTPRYPIGKVVELTGLSARQVRYYEDRGLVRPARSEGNQRLYTDQQIERLRRIRQYRDQGLNTAGIRSLLGEERPGAVESKRTDESTSKRAETTPEQADRKSPEGTSIEEYPARHLLRRDMSRSIYPLSHPEEVLKRTTEERERD